MIRSFAIPALVALTPSFILILSAIIAHRAHSSWGTWMMLLGSFGILVGGTGLGSSVYLLYASLSLTMSNSDASTFETYLLCSKIFSWALAGSIFIFCIGLLGLTTRYGIISRRAEKLETISQIMAAERDESPQSTQPKLS